MCHESLSLPLAILSACPKSTLCSPFPLYHLDVAVEKKLHAKGLMILIRQYSLGATKAPYDN